VDERGASQVTEEECVCDCVSGCGVTGCMSVCDCVLLAVHSFLNTYIIEEDSYK